MEITSYQQKVLNRIKSQELCVYNQKWLAWEFPNSQEFLNLTQIGFLFIQGLVKKSTQGIVCLELTDLGKKFAN